MLSPNRWVALSATLALGAIAAPPPPASPAAHSLTLSGAPEGRELPNYDELAQYPAQDSGQQVQAARAALGLRLGREPRVDPRTGVPSFVWANPSTSAQGTSLARWSSLPSDAARGYLVDFAPLYQAAPADVEALEIAHVHDLGKGPIVVKFRQSVGGVEIFRNEISVLMNRDRELVAISGALAPSARGQASLHVLAPYFALPAEAAVSAAISDMFGTRVDARAVRPVAATDATFGRFEVETSGEILLSEAPRARRVMFDLIDHLEPAYHVEVLGGRADSVDAGGYAYVFSAIDGRLLFRKNLVQNDAFTFRVWADATEPYLPFDGPAGNDVTPKAAPTPDAVELPFIAPQLVTLQNTPFSQNDPWLAVDATATVGNNVDAYVDLVNPDGYGPVMATPGDPATGDFRTPLSAPNEFAWTFDPLQAPNTLTQRYAAVQQMFFNVNVWHDWFYDVGFDEASGNAQTDNFGRGGLGNDSFRAEGQDVSGSNNANMLTPSDGTRPRMQMFLFDFNGLKYLDPISPTAIAGRRPIGTGTFGPQGFDLTSEIVASAPHHGCTAFTNAAQVAGKVVLVNFQSGTGEPSCSIGTKLNNAMAAGAAGFVLVYLQSSPNTVVNVSGSLPSFTIPFLSLSWNGAAAIKAELAVPNAVTVRIVREAGERRDGTIDNTIMAHEWGHYISNRLVGNAIGLNTNMAGGLGEGWGDFHALLNVVKEADLSVPSNAGWNGVFPLSTYVEGGGSENVASYFGIRRVPYSRDFSKNALTFRHIEDGVALPSTHPVQLNGVPNSEVHNTGEVWATMLWECYSSLLLDTSRLTFAEANLRMRSYLVAAYKMTPSSPTLIEARDALLAAAAANDLADYALFGEAFARRGAGTGAIAPDRYNATNAGVVESFVFGPDMELVSMSVSDEYTWCDRDGLLDAGETGVVTVRIRNTGADTLRGVTGLVDSTNAALTFPDGATLRFPDVAPLQEVEASVAVLVGAANNPDSSVLTVAIDGSGLSTPRTLSRQMRVGVNVDTGPASFDDFEAPGLRWSVTRDAALSQDGGFERYTDGSGTVLLGAAPGSASDTRLVSPIMTVDGSGSVNVQFRHRWTFESDASANYDGAVVELSVNGGAWVDIGGPIYNGSIVNYAGNQNPLKTRPALVRTSGPDALLASLTAAVAPGSTVQVRFRIGTDNAAGASGWVLDDIAFNGVVEAPFLRFVANTGGCVNRRPVANAGSDFAADERTLITLDGLGSLDSDGDLFTYAWTQVSGPTVALDSAAIAQPSFTTEVSGDSLLVFQLITTDSVSLTSHPDRVTVTVREVNRLPVISVEDVTSTERSLATLDAIGTSDADGDALTFSWLQTSGSPVTLSGSESPTATFTVPEVPRTGGSWSFTVTVEDGRDEVTETVTVTASDVNRAPLAQAGADQTVGERSGVVVTAAASSDEDSDALTYHWTQLSGPTVSFDATSAEISFTAPEVARTTAELGFQLTVSDGLESHSDEVSVSVTEVNRAPVANAGADQQVDERTEVTLTATGTDADGDSVNFAWTQVSGPTATLLEDPSQTLRFVAPEVTAATEVVFSVRAFDQADSHTDEVIVQIAHLNRAPVASAGEDRELLLGAQLSLSAEASSDPDNDALRYAWTLTEGEPLALTGADAQAAVLTAGAGTKPGRRVFAVTVTDPEGATATDTLEVDVVDPNARACGCSAQGASGLTPFAMLAFVGLLARSRRPRTRN